MKNKAVLWVIVVLLIVCSAMSGYGYFVHVDRIKNPPPENPNKEFKLNDKLWFYNSNKELLSTYECKNKYCGYAISYVDDENYNVRYYAGKTDAEIKLINDRYAFINDTAEEGGRSIILYDAVNKTVVQNLKSVKNYGIGFAKQYMIAENEDGLWGVIKLTNNAGMLIDYKYDYIGVTENYDDETSLLKVDSFIVHDTNGWKVISETGTDLSSYFINEIYDYNDKYTITTLGGYYYLNTISGNALIDDDNRGMLFVGHYLKILTASRDCYFMDLNTMQNVTEEYSVNTIDDVIAEETLNGYEVYINGELVTTLP